MLFLMINENAQKLFIHFNFKDFDNWLFHISLTLIKNEKLFQLIVKMKIY
jgi:hypothetical protein